MRIRIFIVSIAVVIFLSLGFVVVKTKYFVVKKVILPKNVSIKKNALANYLKLLPPRQIWLYNTIKLKKQLSKLSYFKNCDVKKIYPNTIKLIFTIRKPVSLVRGKNGSIYQVDDSGLVFARLNKRKQHLPLIIYQNNNNLTLGVTIKGKEYHIIKVLSRLQKNSLSVYSSISQIKVVKNNFMLDYFVNYVNDIKNIIIKNKINDEILKRGAVCSLFLSDNHKIKNLLFADIGFIF